jgi:HAD superfamily hydrolase (TIGR01549 family)
MKILLFDIDGTLIHSGGSGVHGMNLAFEEISGIPNALHGIGLAGRTDELILQDALDKHALQWRAEQVEQFKTRYYIHLAEDMQKPRDKRRLMPGFPELLDHLHALPHVHLGLLTGNWKTAAEIKLAHFGLWKYFDFGAFADDESDRNKLVPHALRRAQEQFGVIAQRDRVYVIGDTPRDIECARPHGAVAVAVATGDYTVEQLRTHQPDFLFEDFSKVEAVLEVLK